MPNRPLHIIFLLLLLLSISTGLIAQEAAAEQDTTKADRVKIDYSDTLKIIQRGEAAIRKLIGEVKLRQDSIYMDCDSAIISMGDTRVEAMGNVVILQGDSLSVFSDSLIYNGLTRIADLYGNVVLQHGRQRLFTDSLQYNLATKVATYTNGATLVKDETQLSSKRGYYYVDTDEAFFKDSVIVFDPEFNLRADTLKYHTETEVVTFLGPTLITNDSTRLYTEAGYYDTANRLAEFTENAQYVQGEQRARAELIRYNGAREEYSLIGNARFEEGEERRATADTIRYDERNDKTFLFGDAYYVDGKQEITSPQIVYDARNETYSTRGRALISDPPQLLEADTVDFNDELGMGIALGNVLWRDTSANLSIRAERADYDQQSDYLKAMGGPYGRPMLITLIDEDSLYLAADTLLARREDTLSTDSSRIFLAYRDVRIFSVDLQGLCDSLTYSSTDSIFRLFRNPIMWSDTSQFTADTIHMQMQDGGVDQVHLINKGLIINTEDELFYNQIKGKNIIAYFRDDNLDYMDVIGNAESIYYALDEEDAYVGVNETVCSEMTIFWGDNQVESIRFLTQPTGTAHPMGKVNHNELRLEGFKWSIDRRPESLWDLFDRPPPPAKPSERPVDLSVREGGG